MPAADLANDLLRVVETASHVHGLGTACALAAQIITTVQKIKHYTSRLDVLTFFISNSLNSVADRMRATQNNYSKTLTVLLKLYETILYNVNKLIKKYSKSWRVTVVMTARLREIRIRNLELRLRRIQQSIFLLLDEIGSSPDSAAEPQVEVGGRIASSSREGDSKNGMAVLGNSLATSLEAPKSSGPPQVTIHLPGQIIPFKNQHLGSQLSTGSTSFLRQKYEMTSKTKTIPNLTGRIKIIRGPLLAGGFCDIYTGELINEQGTEAVALKMLRVFNTTDHIVKAKKKFREEVGLWCSLSHRHVLPFYGTCEYDEFRLFMVSPWAEGGNSLAYLRGHPSADRGELLWQTASALEYLHSRRDVPQIVHGDLKADNVLVSASGSALLCDFGLSLYVEEIVSKSGSSSGGRGGGHARFMAPELILPKTGFKAKRTPETDVYAFGSLMLQIYTEYLPYGDLLEAEAIINITRGEIPPRPTDSIVSQRGFDDHIWTLMTDCWKFQPYHRPSMKDVMDRMEARTYLPFDRMESPSESVELHLDKEISPTSLSQDSPTSRNVISGLGNDRKPQLLWTPPLLQLRPPTPPDTQEHSPSQRMSIDALKSVQHCTPPNIPPNIWEEIAYHLSRFHLRTWLSVSSFHRKIAWKHVFRTINIYFGGDTYDYDRGLDILVRVRRDENFARMVKILRIHWSYEQGDALDILKRFLHDTLPAFLALQEFEWVGYPEMHPDMVQELLSKHPNIHGLGLVGWHFDAQGVSDFRHLSKFTLRAENDDGFADISEVRTLLDRNQDTLVHLTLGASLIGQHSWVPALQSLTLQKLTHLNLVDTQISASVLMRISFAQNLRSLTLHGTFEHPSAVNVLFGSDNIIDGRHRLLPRLEAFRFIMVGQENEVDDALFKSVLSFLRQRSQLRRLDLGNFPWELVKGVLPGLSGLRVLRIRMQKLNDDTAQDVVNSLPWGMSAIHVSVASSYQPVDVALNVYASHFSRFPMLSILHLESEFPRSLLERINFRSDDATYPWMAQVHSIAHALPSLDFVGWHGVHYVVVRGEEFSLVKLQKSRTRRRLDGGKSVDLGSDDACWLERNDVPIIYEITSLGS